MDKTLSTRRAKISRLKKQADSKLKRFVVDEIKFDRNVLRTLTNKQKIIEKFQCGSPWQSFA